jgi:hypothetical protein
MSRFLRAQLWRFGYMPELGGLLSKIHVIVDIDKESFLEYVDLLGQICGGNHRETGGF